MGKHTKYLYHESDFYSKDKARETFLRLLAPLGQFYSDGCARLEIGVTAAHYENSSALMEAFARPLWGLVPFWAGGGENSGFEEIYRRGIISGTDPESPEYWGKCRDFDQKFCEMPAIAYGLLLAPEKIWEPLSEKEKDNLTEWLWEINRHECCACNWQWFCILTNLALKVRGREYSSEHMESGLKMIDSYYDKGGWYKDGSGGEKDYYNAFVMLSYGLIYAMFMEQEEPERCAEYRKRAKEFAKEYVYLFSPDGSSIAYGRSMTYRFAQCAFFSTALLSGTEVLPVPVMKGLIARHLVWWLNQPIFDNAGVLSIGYAYPNIQMSESYNGPGSPYWAFTAFAFLALPDEHQFWNAPCAPFPELESLHFLPGAGMIIQRGKNNAAALVAGHLHPDGHSHAIEKYSKFAYSSSFSFSISRSNLNLHECAPDSSLAFLVNGFLYVKDVIEPDFTLNADEIIIKWTPLAGIKVCTTIRPCEKGHLRIHEIESNFDCEAYDCGFAVSTNDLFPFERNSSGTTAEVKSGDGYCRVSSLTDGEGRILIPDPNTNLIAPKTSVPMAVYTIRKGKQTIKTLVEYL